MYQTIQLAILGAFAGCLIALLASGIVLTYRSSRIINFAHGAIATFGTFTFLHCVNAWDWPNAAAIVAGVAASTFLGLGFQLLVLRPLRNSAPLARVVATLGLLIAINASIRPIFGEDRPASVRLFGSETIELPFGRPAYFVPSDRLILGGITAVILVVLYAVYRYSRFGIATRAAADNMPAAAQLGISSTRVESLNWMLASALAGLAGILLSVVSSPDTLGYTMMMIAALAAALVGGFGSFSITFVAAVVLGIGQAVLLRYEVQLQSATQLAGWGQALPFVVILIALVVKGRSVARKGSFDEEPLPMATKSLHPWLTSGVCVVLGVAWISLIPINGIAATTISLCVIVIALSVVVVTGFAGQISLAQMGLAGVGAWVAARLAEDIGLAFPLPILLGGLCAVPVGMIIGLPALRVRGLQLAIVTLGAAIVLDVMFFNSPSLSGADAGLPVPPARLGPLDLDSLTHPRAYAMAVLVMTILVGLGVVWLRHGPWGRALLAARSNERGAAASGLSVTRAKLTAFAIGAFIAGVGGGMQAYSSPNITWEGYSYLASVFLVAMVYIGGIASIGGAVVAGLTIASGIVNYYLNFSGTAADIYQAVGGLGVMMVVVLHPEGVAGIPRQIRRHVASRRSSTEPQRRADYSLSDIEDVSREALPARGKVDVL